MELFKILGTIALEGTDQFNSDVTEASNQGKDLADSFGTKVKKGLKVGATAVAAVGTACVAMTKAVFDGAKEVAAYGDHVDKMSQKIGISSESYQEWDFIMGQCGMSVDQLQTGMKTLSSAAYEGNEAFGKLGISQAELSTLGTEDLFNRTIDALAGMEEGAERTALATALFGKSATDMMPLLNQGAEGIEALRQQAIDYGLILTDETIAASAAFTDSLTLMSKTFNGLKYRMMAEFLPACTEITDGLAMLFTGNMEGLTMLNQGVTDFTTTLLGQVPVMLEVGMSILTTLASAIVANIPQLTAAAVSTITMLLSYLLTNMPTLLTAGMTAITQIISGLASAMPDLIPQAVLVVAQLLSALIDNAPQLLAAGIEFITQCVVGLVGAIPTLLAEAPNLLSQLLASLISAATMLTDAGTEMVNKIKESVSSAWPGLQTKVSNLMNNIKTSVTTKANGIKTSLTTAWNSMSTSVASAMVTMQTKVASGLNEMKTAYSNAGGGMRGIVAATMTGISGLFKGGLSIINTLTNGKFNAITTAISGAMESAKTKVSNAIDALKGYFNFDWSLPSIKMPHFTISGSFSLNPPSVPSFGISWYAKGAVLNDPTAFGMNGNNLMVGGEAGPEAVAPIDVLQGYVSEAVSAQNAELKTVLVKILDAIEKMDSNMGGNMATALDGTSLSINNREFGRLVRQVV